MQMVFYKLPLKTKLAIKLKKLLLQMTKADLQRKKLNKCLKTLNNSLNKTSFKKKKLMPKIV